jgi:hypothetical protein
MFIFTALLGFSLVAFGIVHFVWTAIALLMGNAKIVDFKKSGISFIAGSTLIWVAYQFFNN